MSNSANSALLTTLFVVNLILLHLFGAQSLRRLHKLWNHYKWTPSVQTRQPYTLMFSVLFSVALCLALSLFGQLSLIIHSFGHSKAQCQFRAEMQYASEMCLKMIFTALVSLSMARVLLIKLDNCFFSLFSQHTSRPIEPTSSSNESEAREHLLRQQLVGWRQFLHARCFDSKVNSLLSSENYPPSDTDTLWKLKSMFRDNMMVTLSVVSGSIIVSLLLLVIQYFSIALSAGLFLCLIWSVLALCYAVDMYVWPAQLDGLALQHQMDLVQVNYEVKRRVWPLTLALCVVITSHEIVTSLSPLESPFIGSKCNDRSVVWSLMIHSTLLIYLLLFFMRKIVRLKSIPENVARQSRMDNLLFRAAIGSEDSIEVITPNDTTKPYRPPLKIVLEDPTAFEVFMNFLICNKCPHYLLCMVELRLWLGLCMNQFLYMDDLNTAEKGSVKDDEEDQKQEEDHTNDTGGMSRNLSNLDASFYREASEPPMVRKVPERLMMGIRGRTLAMVNDPQGSQKIGGLMDRYFGMVPSEFISCVPWSLLSMIDEELPYEWISLSRRKSMAVKDSKRNLITEEEDNIHDSGNQEEKKEEHNAGDVIFASSLDPKSTIKDAKKKKSNDNDQNTLMIGNSQLNNNNRNKNRSMLSVLKNDDLSDMDDFIRMFDSLYRKYFDMDCVLKVSVSFAMQMKLDFMHDRCCVKRTIPVSIMMEMLLFHELSEENENTQVVRALKKHPGSTFLQCHGFGIELYSQICRVLRDYWKRFEKTPEYKLLFQERTADPRFRIKQGSLEDIMDANKGPQLPKAVEIAAKSVLSS